MFTLYWDANDFGINAPHVKANYATLAEALAQARHDLKLGRHPTKITDANGKELWNVKSEPK